ncbi:MAG: FecR domain-containing protein [Nannocystales bacterium]
MKDAVPHARFLRMRRRLRERAEASATPTRRHIGPKVAFVAGALVAVVGVVALQSPQAPVATRAATGPMEAEPVAIAPPRKKEPTTAARPPVETSALAARGTGCDATTINTTELVTVAGPCVLSGGGVQVQVVDAATLRGNGARVELAAGAADFNVAPRVAGERPFVVQTPAVAIQVTGTRFSLAQDIDRGTLEMHEGHVQLVVTASDHQRQVVAGETLHWVREASGFRLETASDTGTSSSPEAASSPQPAKRRGHKPDVDSVVRRVEALRGAGEFSEATRVITRALPSLRRRDRAVLSFELGELIERSRGTEAACAHWRAYLREFPKSRYTSLVLGERARLRCNPEGD